MVQITLQLGLSTLEYHSSLFLKKKNTYQICNFQPVRSGLDLGFLKVIKSERIGCEKKRKKRE